MRGTVAKRFRNEARKTSMPTTYRFEWIERVSHLFGKFRQMTTVRSEGYRATYQGLKKAYKSGR